MKKVQEVVYGEIAAIARRHGMLGKIGDTVAAAGVPRGALRVAHDSDTLIYGGSVRRFEGAVYALCRIGTDRVLAVFSPLGKTDPELGKSNYSADGVDLVLLPADWDTYQVIRTRFPFVVPVSLRERKTTIGMGDRLGLATPGHIGAARRFAASPVLAQQSIRELTLTKRTYRDVVSDSAFGVFQEGFDAGYGADGDHLKTIGDIDVALDAGMPMITLDLTEVMDPTPSNVSDAEVESRFLRLDAEVRRRVLDGYAGKTFRLGSGSAGASSGTGATEVVLGDIEAKRCALMYMKALDFTEEVDRHLRRARGDSYDLEVSIDETTAPTLPSHHVFIASELKRRRVTVSSLAPRFVGEFQKGIDYIGDLDEFERQFVVHCRIAREFGGYKISIHSGSDKFSVYPIIGRHTGLRVHVKTAGTSWLEAVRTVATHDPDLYRAMHAKAYDYFPDATKLYHITADLGKIAPLENTADGLLPTYLDRNESRQLLHISYGGLLSDPEIRQPFFRFLSTHEEEHSRFLERHLAKHMRLLGLGDGGEC